MSKPIEILRFLKLADGTKAMRIRGELYSAVDDVPDQRVQKVIRRTIAEMVEMAGGIDQLAEEGLIELPISQTPVVEEVVQTRLEPAPPPEAIQAETRQEIEEVSIAPTQTEAVPTAAQEAFLESLRNQAIEAEADKPAGRDNSFFGRLRGLTARQPEESEELLPKLDMAGQIDTILQEKLKQIPAYSGRQIELRSKLNGELAFIVDGSSHESVNDIPNEEIKAIFRKSITEWENRNL